MIEVIKTEYFFTVLPEEVVPSAGACLTRQELYDLAPEGSDLKQELADDDSVDTTVE